MYGGYYVFMRRTYELWNGTYSTRIETHKAFIFLLPHNL